MYGLLEKVALVIVFFISIIYSLELLLKWKRHQILQHIKSIPTPNYVFPVLGHVWIFLRGPQSLILKSENYHYKSRTVSNFKFWIFHKVFVIIAKAEDVALTLGSPNFSNKGAEYTILQESIMGQGIFSTTNLTEWRKNRKLIAPTFHFQILKTFISNFYDQANILANNLIQIMEEEGEVEVYRPMGLCTLDMIMQNAMGVSVNAQWNSNHVFVQGLETILNIWQTRFFKPWLWNRYIFCLTSLKTQHDKTMRDIQSFANGVILKKMEERYGTTVVTAKPKDESSVEDNDTSGRKLKKPKEFLDLLIEYAYDGVDERCVHKMIENLRATINSKYTIDKQGESTENFVWRLINRLIVSSTRNTLIEGDTIDANKDCATMRKKVAELENISRQIRDEVITIMIGGHETTACENSFIVLLLAMHQEVQQKVVVEIDEIFGNDCRSPCYEDLQKMEYLECVIKETMRLYPSLPLIVRCAEKDTVLSDNSVLHKGCSTCYFVFRIHRDPQYYTDPDCFIPERFLPDNRQSRHPYCFIPFAAGARNCIGQKYAMFQMKTLISTFVRRFKILPSARMPTMDCIRLKLTTTLRSKTGCWVKLERRNTTTEKK